MLNEPDITIEKLEKIASYIVLKRNQLVKNIQNNVYVKRQESLLTAEKLEKYISNLD
jgi:hypothetical protein